jgi:hypothetical protein
VGSALPVLMASPCLRWCVKTRCGGAGHGGGSSTIERGKANVPTACRAEPHTAADGGDSGALPFIGSVTGEGLVYPAAEFER